MKKTIDRRVGACNNGGTVAWCDCGARNSITIGGQYRPERKRSFLCLISGGDSYVQGVNLKAVGSLPIVRVTNRRRLVSRKNMSLVAPNLTIGVKDMKNEDLIPTLWEAYLKIKPITCIDEAIHSQKALDVTFDVGFRILEAIAELTATTERDRQIKLLAVADIVEGDLSYRDIETLCTADYLKLTMVRQLIDNQKEV
jgi:hypothetical protein